MPQPRLSTAQKFRKNMLLTLGLATAAIGGSVTLAGGLDALGQSDHYDFVSRSGSSNPHSPYDNKQDPMSNGKLHSLLDDYADNIPMIGGLAITLLDHVPATAKFVGGVSFLALGIGMYKSGRRITPQDQSRGRQNRPGRRSALTR